MIPVIEGSHASLDKGQRAKRGGENAYVLPVTSMNLENISTPEVQTDVVNNRYNGN